MYSKLWPFFCREDTRECSFLNCLPISEAKVEFLKLGVICHFYFHLQATQICTIIGVTEIPRAVKLGFAYVYNRGEKQLINRISKERSESANQILLFSLPQFSSQWFVQLYLVWPQSSILKTKSLNAGIPKLADKSCRLKLLWFKPSTCAIVRMAVWHYKVWNRGWPWPNS